ncbi:type IV fimbrial biogenesis protein FimT [Desulfobotulus alkaliphilus]|uniref:Type II secretion system protein H n=1 Tax=Desulfobotulus alkaliphilus TaxID=622671 RepID=A0A562RRR5_9BACT|nr:GspH/FimT family protein [Desulfobotulus alkaliphilus]TWI71809.1 type IV fimbrial biogenesis protein FimT [Desulfobotulus alkaliphilus]
MGNQKAFTLIEVVIIMALIGIIAAIATPTFREVRENNQKKTAAFTLGTALSYARNEAVTRGVTVTICRSANPNAPNVAATPAPACSKEKGEGWETGYIVFVDSNDSGTLGSRDAGQELLRVFPPARGGIAMPGTGNAADRIIYNPTGFSRNAAGKITVGSDSGSGVKTSKTHYEVDIAANGRFSTKGPKKIKKTEE